MGKVVFLRINPKKKNSKKKNIKHLFIYPRCPRINAYIERQNRTLQDEFIDSNESLVLLSTYEFNEKLIDYLIWYNCQGPHKSLNNLSPIDFIVKHYLKNYRVIHHLAFEKNCVIISFYQI